MSVVIQLTKGYTAIVDDEDADLAAFKWQVAIKPVNKAYAQRGIYEGRAITQSLHRVVLARVLSRELARNEYVDHIDGDSLNNRRSNLRLCTLSQNSHNAKRRSDNTSGYKGVYFDKTRGCWRAHIRLNNKRKSLGAFSTPEEAHQAYCNAARELFGEFANFGN